MPPTPSLLESRPHTKLADEVARLPGSRRDVNDRKNLGRLSAASLCLAFIVSLLSGCRGQVKAPEPAEITDLSCGRSCLVSQAGPSTVVWVSE